MTMNVVFCPEMIAPAQGFSPSANKPGQVMKAWQELWPELVIRPAMPVSETDFVRAHKAEYVADVFALRSANGFGSRSAEVNASLPYTSGALLTAARWALAEKTNVAAPVSGFHHACWGSGGGFCTFNGLMVTALALQADHADLKVGILDYDYHYGNGTDDIVDVLGAKNIVHITAGRTYQQADQAQDFLSRIDDDLIALSNCDIVLYQAGADPHVDDPLGGFLTTEELAARDRKVFMGMRAYGVPVAWDLAGGYQNPLSKVITIHEITMRACIQGMTETITNPPTQNKSD